MIEYDSRMQQQRKDKKKIIIFKNAMKREIIWRGRSVLYNISSLFCFFFVFCFYVRMHGKLTKVLSANPYYLHALNQSIHIYVIKGVYTCFTAIGRECVFLNCALSCTIHTRSGATEAAAAMSAKLRCTPYMMMQCICVQVAVRIFFLFFLFFYV